MKILKLKILIEKKKKKKNEIPLTSDDYKEIEKKFGKDRECSFHRDSDGYYCKTHRTRSKSYKEIKNITMKDFNFVSSTS